MNSYLGDNSIIIMNNARIHYDNRLVELLEKLECYIIFLSPYSPDYNPIKIAFLTSVPYESN